ncbi:MAG: AI-2E family transporter [Candidatus Eremiobacteraeota bacterium]|nr:AI-2E family transporter [Candidatus Eremiobacteraeota bacterium]
MRRSHVATLRELSARTAHNSCYNDSTGLARPDGEASRMREPHSNPWRWMTDARLTYVLKVLMVVVLALYAAQFILAILGSIHTVVFILIGSVFLAYLIYPAVHRLRRRMPLVVAIVLIYVAILAVLALVGFFIVPRISDDVSALVTHYPSLADRLHSILYDPRDPLTSRMPAFVRVELAKMPQQFGAWVATRGLQSFGHVIAVLAGTFAVIAVFIIVPMLTAYLLLDLDNLRASLAAIVPERRWRATLGFLNDIDDVIGSFIRGQLIVALSVGILIAVVLMFLRVPYPYLFGLLAAVGDLIPYVGAVLAFIPAFSSSLLTNGWFNALFVTIAFVAIYEIEGHLIAPNIVGRQVKLSAFIVLLSLLIGAELGGLFGMLVAVPIAGVLRVIALRVVRAANTK